MSIDKLLNQIKRQQDTLAGLRDHMSAREQERLERLQKKIFDTREEIEIVTAGLGTTSRILAILVDAARSRYKGLGGWLEDVDPKECSRCKRLASFWGEGGC